MANGQSDIFEYKLPKQADMIYINAFARTADGTGYEVYLNTFNCPTQPSNSSRGEFDATDRDEMQIAKNGVLKLYPNPNSGLLFVDLSDWDAQEITLSVISATGQYLQQMTVQAGDSATALRLPETIVNGLYMLEMKTADGARQVRRFVVQR